jgi:acyl-CoA thioester hydrolase
VPTSELIPTYATAVNTWQCDENDHLNVRFYTELAHEASASLMTALGLGRRAQTREGLAVSAKEDHLRYLREFRVNDPIEVRSAPVEIGEHDLLIYHEVRNALDGTVAATARRRLVADKPWPAAFRTRAEQARIELPAKAQPRSVGAARLPDLTLAQAADVGLFEVGRTMIKPSECDIHGVLLAHHQTGRYSDAAPMLWQHVGLDRAAMQRNQEGSVVIEIAQYYRNALGVGDCAVVMSGLTAFSDKIVKLVHFLFDAETGMLAACAEGVGVKFDQKMRKIVLFSDDERARLGERKLRW